MSKFIITCPVCHNYAEASTGFFCKQTHSLFLRKYH